MVPSPPPYLTPVYLRGTLIPLAQSTFPSTAFPHNLNHTPQSTSTFHDLSTTRSHHQYLSTPTPLIMAQREAYQLPEHRNNFSQSQSQSQGQTSGGAYNYAAGVTRVPTETDQAGVSVTYKCGECGAQVALFKGDVVRCDKCGHRVLYKERTKRMVQFEAR
jgi:DNA-directed RNA polymerases I, II, and III subunit RPABC4